MSFQKRLNFWDSTSMVIGSMIGSGIFIVSADMAKQIGSPGWLLTAWFITGIMTTIAALSYGELAGMMPQAGGLYVYLREAFGPLIGFLYGWTTFIVIQCGTIAALGMAFSKFMGVLFPWISSSNILLNLGFLKFNIIQCIAICSIILLTMINLQGIEEGKKVQNIFTFSKTLILVFFIIIGFYFIYYNHPIKINNHFWSAVDISTNSHIAGITLFMVLGTAMVGSIFSVDAWYNITFASAEVINPKRNIPLSLFWGTFSVSLIYILINIIYINVLPFHSIQFANEDRVGTAAMNMISGQNAVILMALVVMISTFGCNNGIILSGARLYWAMAKDGLFFNNIGKLNKNSVPANGLLYQAAWSILLCFSGTYNQLLDYVIFAVLLFNTLIIASIYKLRKSRPTYERPYKAFGYPILPALYIIFCIWVMVAILIYKPTFTWPGLLIVLFGIPVYLIWNKRKEKRIKRNIDLL